MLQIEPHGRLPKNLWEEAYDVLREDDKDLVDKYEHILSTEVAACTADSLSGNGRQLQEQMAALVAKKSAAMRSKQWRFIIRGKPVEIREQVGRMLKILTAVKDAISPLASMEPFHAGIPWAGFCLLLPVSVSLHQMNEGACCNSLFAYKEPYGKATDSLLALGK